MSARAYTTTKIGMEYAFPSFAALSLKIYEPFYKWQQLIGYPLFGVVLRWWGGIGVDLS
jgi:hypothetical protein